MALTVLKEKKKQRKLVIILAVLVLLIIIVNYKTFFDKPKTQEISFDQVKLIPKINIDFNLLDSPILAMLKPFELIGLEYEYTVTTEEGEVTDTIIATSEEEAMRILAEMGLFDVNFKKIETGRRNPFMPY